MSPCTGEAKDIAPRLVYVPMQTRFHLQQYQGFKKEFMEERYEKRYDKIWEKVHEEIEHKAWTDWVNIANPVSLWGGIFEKGLGAVLLEFKWKWNIEKEVKMDRSMAPHHR